MICFRQTPIGTVGIGEKNNAVNRLFLPPGIHENGSMERASPLLEEAFAQLGAYLEGKRHIFDLPLCPAGTPFMRRVWDALLHIPYGTTVSYGNIAGRIGNAKAARAVGLACNRNPIPILIPCHRVVGSSGNLTGYAGGLDLKRRLLNIESLYGNILKQSGFQSWSTSEGTGQE